MSDLTVDEPRLAELFDHVGNVGWDPANGMDRIALEANDVEARRRLAERGQDRGFAVTLDEIGNLHIERAGKRSDLAPVACGSHIDAQPGGGRFDGAVGVIGGLEALLTIDDAAITTARPIELVVWTNEEGVRFSPTTMGSAVFAGALPLEVALHSTDDSGVTVSDELDAMRAALALPTTAATGPPAAYVELHIEQGPVLERAAEHIGVVEGIQGIAWVRAHFHGIARHAGTTPHSDRADAALAAARAIVSLDEWRALTDDPLLRITAGRLQLTPNSPNTVAGDAFLTIDIRHPNAHVLERAVEEIAPRCVSAASPLPVTVEQLQFERPAVFDPDVVHVIEAVSRRAGARWRRMVSGATHDALHLAARCPTCMIFIPCRDGVSHHRTEQAAMNDIALGATVLANTLVELSKR